MQSKHLAVYWHNYYILETFGNLIKKGHDYAKNSLITNTANALDNKTSVKVWSKCLEKCRSTLHKYMSLN